MRTRSISLIVLLSVLAVTAAKTAILPCDSKYGCQLCSTNDQTDTSQKCLVCYNGYDLVDNYCKPSMNTCSSRSGHPCTIPNCIVELPLFNTGSYFCQECASPYQPFGQSALVTDRSYCEYLCPYTQQYLKEVSLCKPVCKVSGCDLCSTGNENQCVDCQSSLLNLKGQCVELCPTKTYQSGSQCLDCDPQCASCTITSNHCTLCQDAAVASPPDCACPTDTYFSSTSCVSKCPYLQGPKDGLCQRICPLMEYPSFLPNQSFVCSRVNYSDDEYCIQNLKEIPSLISVSFSKINDQIYRMSISLKDTPRVCYNYQLKGTDSFQFGVYDQLTDESHFISYTIQLSDVQNANNVECNAEKCYIKFLIFWKNFLSYSYQITLEQKLQGDLINTLSFNNEVVNEAIACEKCEIPKYAIINSTIEVTCSAGQTCTSNSIQSKVTQPIKITQFISDETMKNRKVFPHSLQISYLDTNYGRQVQSYINNYDYTNDVAGQITYTFYSLPVADAQLKITSTITDAKVSRLLSVSSRFLDSTGNSSVRYPQMIMSITVDEETKTSDSSTVLVAVLVPTLCLLLAISGFWAFRIFKKRQVKLISEKNENQEIQVGQQDNDNNGEQVKIPLEIKVNQDASQKTIAPLPQDIAKDEKTLKSPKKIGQNEEILPQNSKRLEKKKESSHGELNDIIMFEDQSVDQESHNSQ